MVASTSFASMRAKPSPMQIRVPPPNGKNEYCGRFAVSPGAQRSGSNRHGSGNQRGSWWVTHWLSTIIELPRDRVAAELVVDERPAAEQPDRRVQPQGLVDHPLGVLERGQIVHDRQPVADHSVELLVQAGFDLGVLREQVPDPGQEIRGRLVTGEEDRHRLVAHLAIGHALAPGLVTRP